MKTPEEIKKAMRHCLTSDYQTHPDPCRICPFGDDCHGGLSDALGYIEQLEETICLMKVQMHGDCGVCKHRTGFDVEGAIMSQKCYECLKKESRPNWEYEGLPEVGSKC